MPNAKLTDDEERAKDIRITAVCFWTVLRPVLRSSATAEGGRWIAALEGPVGFRV